MFVRRTVIAAALVAVPIAFAASAQATPATCSYFGADESKAESQGICGVPDLAGTFGQVRTNLENNFSPKVAAGNLQGNLDPGTAAGHLQGNLDPGTAADNLEHAITHGVGTDDPPA